MNVFLALFEVVMTIYFLRRLCYFISYFIIYRIVSNEITKIVEIVVNGNMGFI